jgi:uracil-DNA glycosylase
MPLTLDAISKWVKKKSTPESPTVPGEGSVTAKIVLVGECPGRTEVLEQKPFVGRTGKILRRALKEAGFTDEDIKNNVYITNSIKEWLPIGKVPPSNKIIYWRRMLTLELGIIKPKLIVAVGKTAARSLGKKANLIVPHPGSIRFNKNNYNVLVEAFKKVKTSWL